jgi:hypothetical protein
LIAALHRGGLPRGIAVCYASGMDAALSHLIDAVEAELEATAHEYAQMPFFVRPLVKRGFEKRTGRGFAAWRALLADARRGQRTRELADALRALAEHYQGAPARARRGMGATTAQLAIVEQRSRVRSDAARALREALVERAVPDPPVG